MSFRVIQWATGNVGRSALRAIARQPELEVVGGLVFDPAKAGRDLGELCGLDPLGVTATDDRDAILALDADCVLHAPLPSARYGPDPGADLHDLCELLESGKNVVTTVGYVYPRAYGDDVVDRLEAACTKGKSSLHGTGVNPGWLNELLPLTMSSLSDRIDCVSVLESTDFSFYPSRQIIFEMMGFGSEPAVFEQSAERYRNWLTGLFRESVCMLADGLAVELEGIATDVELSLAEKRFEIAAGVVEAGTIAGQRWTWRGRAAGYDRIVLEAVYRASRDVSPGWPEPGVKVEIAGRPRMTLELDEGWLSNGLVGTALHAVHAIPHVCRAAPGVRTFLDLPLMVGRNVASGPVRADPV